jgi:hypothetical protein
MEEPEKEMMFKAWNTYRDREDKTLDLFEHISLVTGVDYERVKSFFLFTDKKEFWLWYQKENKSNRKYRRVLHYRRTLDSLITITESLN